MFTAFQDHLGTHIIAPSNELVATFPAELSYEKAAEIIEALNFALDHDGALPSWKA